MKKSFVLLTSVLVLAFSTQAFALMQPEKQRVATVSNAQELIKNIASNTHIKLKAGKYYIGRYNAVPNDNLIRPSYPPQMRADTGFATDFIIHGVSNLTIEGIADTAGESQIVGDDDVQTILGFEGCKHVEILQVGIARIKKSQRTAGTAISITDCSDISISGCLITGKVATGLDVTATDGLHFGFSSIKNCSKNTIYAQNIANSEFQENVTLLHSGELPLMHLEGYIKNVTFDGCCFCKTGNAQSLAKFGGTAKYAPQRIVAKNCKFMKYTAKDLGVLRKEGHIKVVAPKFITSLD